MQHSSTRIEETRRKVTTTAISLRTKKSGTEGRRLSLRLGEPHRFYVRIPGTIRYILFFLIVEERDEKSPTLSATVQTSSRKNVEKCLVLRQRGRTDHPALAHRCARDTPTYSGISFFVAAPIFFPGVTTLPAPASVPLSLCPSFYGERVRRRNVITSGAL